MTTDATAQRPRHHVRPSNRRGTVALFLYLRTLAPTVTAEAGGYNPRGMLTSLSNQKNDSTVLSSFTYTLDNVGNRSTMTEQDNANSTWTYACPERSRRDDLYQLKQEVKKNSAQTVIVNTSYTYDTRRTALR